MVDDNLHNLTAEQHDYVDMKLAALLLLLLEEFILHLE
jgi:hypothetical protein